VGLLGAAPLLVASAARADDPAAREYFVPRHPVAFMALSAGAGGFGAGSAPGPDGQTTGILASGMLAARVDLVALAPFWASVTGRAFTSHPAQNELDASVGYEMRWYVAEYGHGVSYSRYQLRPFLGVRELRFAADPGAPTTELLVAPRAGADFALVSSEGLRGFDLARARIQLLWDPIARGPGFELEDVIGISTKQQSASGAFVGLTLGGMPSTGLMFQIELGGQWEVGW
jgi:hypothetical protein